MPPLAGPRQPAPPVVHFRDLGPLLVERDGRVRPVGGARLEAALAILLINADRPVSPDALSEAMWGAQSSPRSVATLDSHIYRLRQLLEPTRRPGESSKALLRSSAGFRLVVTTTDQVDSLRFERLAIDAADLLMAGSPDRALRRTVEALTLWRGRPFGDAADESWAAAAVGRLEERRAQVQEAKIGALLATGATEPALADLEMALVAQPLRERLWAYRMIAYRDSGRRAEALAAYSTARSVLVDELGIEPGPELRELHAALLTDDSGPAPADRLVMAVSHRSTPANQARHGVARASGGLLPMPRSRLIGRSRELAELQGAVPARPLVTVVGPGGCGKTRLATEVATTLAAEFPDGVWFVDLTAANSDHVLDAVSSAVELSMTPAIGGPLAALRSFTRDRRMLLVLDNCEHVLDDVAGLLEQLVRDGSELAVLATSREPLDVGDEHVIVLDPLSVAGDDSPAVELFLERLDKLSPGAANTPDARTVAHRIAVAVDGLPLALELAAGRARAYSLAEIAAEVSADASTLSRSGRGLPAHHSTLRASIDHSYRALGSPEAAMHRAVSVVPGPFTSELAGALVAADSGPGPSDPAHVRDRIARLVHRSMLSAIGPARPTGPSRFAQLATVRGHAANELAELADDCRERRDKWVERLVRSRPHLGSRAQASWYRALDDDLAALRATLHYTLIDRPTGLGVALAARLGLFWTFNGLSVEGFGWVGAAMAACENDAALGTPTDRALVRITFAAAASLQSQPEVAGQQMRAAISESMGAVGGDAELLCADLAVATGPIFWAQDAELLAEMARAISDLADGTARLDVLVRHADATMALLTSPADPNLPGRLDILFADAQSHDNLFTAWIAAVAMALVLMASGQFQDALVWARLAVKNAIELGLRDVYLTAETLGCVLAGNKDHENAVRVLALAEAAHVRGGMRWPTNDATAALVDASVAAVGRGAAERARAEGRQMSLVDLAHIGSR